MLGVEKASQVVGCKLGPKECCESLTAKSDEIGVEVVCLRGQKHRLDAGGFGASAEFCCRAPSGSVVVADDIEPLQARWQNERSEVTGGERSHHGHMWQYKAKRQNGLDALAGCHHVVG